MLAMAPVRTGNSALAEIGRLPPKKSLMIGVSRAKSQVIVATLRPLRPLPFG